MKTPSRTVLVIVSLVVGIAVGITGTLVSRIDDQGDDRATEFSLNSRGLTYGQVDTTSREGDRPDLVAVTTSDGIDGYAYSVQLFTPTPQAPTDSASGEQRRVPVYDISGTEQLGFTLVN